MDILKELAKLYPGEKFKVRFRPYSDGDMVSIDYVNPALRTEEQTICEMTRSLHPKGPLFAGYHGHPDLWADGHASAYPLTLRGMKGTICSTRETRFRV